MPATGLGKRFFDTTRGRIVVLLRREVRTVEELARALALTDNAIRSHLTTLERDEIVRQDGVRRGQGAGKPATLYALHPEAEPFFSHAYAPMLGALLEELAEQLPRERAESMLRAIGRRLAARTPRATGDLDARALAAAATLEALGGVAQVERREDGALVVRGCGCPLSSATARHPELCQAVESLLSEVIGVPVRSCCERGERPRCRFVVGPQMS
jgi:predicted ArsR family transcriptional regulator